MGCDAVARRRPGGFEPGLELAVRTEAIANDSQLPNAIVVAAPARNANASARTITRFPCRLSCWSNLSVADPRCCDHAASRASFARSVGSRCSASNRAILSCQLCFIRNRPVDCFNCRLDRISASHVTPLGPRLFSSAISSAAFRRSAISRSRAADSRGDACRLIGPASVGVPCPASYWGKTDRLPLVARLQISDDHRMEKDETSIGVAAEVSRQAAAPGAREEVLQIAPRIYREYAKSFRELARTSESEPQRYMFLKAAQMWLDAATRFEFETGHYAREQQPAA
jgi:hypothetical protein